jgi:tetratricopeptide (TPR) repeat protein
MEKNTDDYEKYIAYHKGKASDKEKAEIESSIKNDPDAKKEFDEFGMLEENIRLYYWQKEAEKALKEPNKFRLSFNWKRISLAASLVLLSTISYFSLNKNYLQDIIIEKAILRSTNSHHAPTPSPQEASYNLFVLGKASYYANDFESAIKSFEEALKTPNMRNQIQEAIQWHLCVAYLRNSQPLEAEKILNDLEKIENPKYEIGGINKAKVRTQIFLKKHF